MSATATEAAPATAKVAAPTTEKAESKPVATPLQRAVEEFKAETRSLGLRADSPGARASSGPKPQWHGRVFENLRNDMFDAIPHQIRQLGGDKSLLRRNQFGFNVGGPVIIPKLFNGSRTTFFSVSYEGMRERISRSTLTTVPTLGERTGDFSQTVDASGAPLPIFDPQTTRANPAYDPSKPVSVENLQYLRDPFPGNIIPVDRLEPKALSTIGIYPTPNASVGPFFQNNYFVVSPETNTANGFITKLDHTVAEHHRLEFGAAWSNGFAGSAQLMPGSIADPSKPDHEFRSRRASVKHIWTVSPRIVNSAEFEASTDGSMNQANAFPYYNFGYLHTGKVNPLGRYSQAIYDWSDNLSWKRGKHNFRWYAELMHQQLTAYYDWFPQGNWDFSSGLTSLPGIVNTGHPFATFLLGMSDSLEMTQVTSPSYFRRTRLDLSMRDKYEVTPSLTVSGSLHLMVSQPRTEKYDRQSTVSFDVPNPENGMPGALIAADRNGVGDRFQPVQELLMPALSVAWSPRGNSRTVVRFDASRWYDTYHIYPSQFGTQGFNAAQTYIAPNAQLSPAVTLASGLPPSPPLPDLRPDAVNNMAADYVDQSGHLPRVNSASLSVERELPGSLVVSAGLDYSDGKNMWAGNGAVDLNAIRLDDLTYRDELNNESFRQALRPYPQYLGFDVNGQYADGRYRRDGGFVKIEKRSSRGLSLTATYQYINQLDDYSGYIQDFNNRNNEWARTVYLSPHRISMSYVYELPFGPGKEFFRFSDWRRYLVDGWSLSGMTSFYSGSPLILRPLFNNTGGLVKYLHVNVVPGVDPNVANPSAELWFNPAAFAQPDDFTIGDGPRTHPSLLTPGSQNHDLSVTKRFAIDSERALELSAVAFNFLNHANLNEPDTTIGPESAPNVNAGKIIGTVGGRVIQVGVRWSF